MTQEKGRGKSVSSLPVRIVTFKIQIATDILVDTEPLGNNNKTQDVSSCT